MAAWAARGEAVDTTVPLDGARTGMRDVRTVDADASGEGAAAGASIPAVAAVAVTAAGAAVVILRPDDGCP